MKSSLRRRFEIKTKIRKWKNSFIHVEKDYGQRLLKDCYWNQMVKEEILKLENEYNNIKRQIDF